MKKHFYVLGAANFALAALLAISCSNRGGGGENKYEEASVRLFLGKLEVPLFDSISVRVSAADMESIHISEKSVSDNLRIYAIPQGEARKFEVTIYADSGKPVLKGEAISDIEADEGIDIPIALEALAGFLRLEVPLGIHNTTGVHSGKLFVKNLSFDMKIETGKGVFSTGSLPLDKEITLRIELYDARGAIMFTGSESLTLTSILQSKTIQLKSTAGSVNLVLKADYDGPRQIVAILPESKTRAPENFGDLFFTEIYAYPKVSGEPFEYMEVYNATLDSLDLSSCSISISSKLKMPENLILPPMEFLFFGRDSVENADFNYKSFSITNTGFNISFICNNSVIDSLATKDANNKFPLAMGKAMQLPLANYNERHLGTSWCFGFSPKQEAACQ